MLKKTVTYTDYNGAERTEDFYFNLTKAELAEMQMSVNGGLEVMMEKLIQTQDQAAIIKIFKDIVLKAYGVKSLDGKRFMKEKPDGSRYADEFKETEAYSIIFMELAQDAKKAADFFNGIVPQNLSDN